MAGAKVAEEILARTPDRFAITMFGDEPRGNYNRIALSAVLGGYKDVSDIVLNPASWYEEHDIDLHAGWRVARIDRSRRQILARDAEHGESCEVGYDQVILATGSRPFVPPLDGLGKSGT